MHIKGDTLDDLLRGVLRALLRNGTRNVASKGATRELLSVLLTLDDPRARFSRAEGRAVLFSCLGELLWHLAGSDRLDFIEYYIPRYREFADIPADRPASDGAYGPRIFSRESDQVQQIVELLTKKKTTRRAVIQIFGNQDRGNYDTPCTCTLQFLPRGGKLHLLTNMRSNDAYVGLPHDVFAFTMLQELVARSIGYDLGSYSHAVGSLHLYDENESGARSYLSEDWQAKISMPPMPPGDPWSSVRLLLDIELSIRFGARTFSSEGLDPYWADLARILLIKALLADDDRRQAIAVGKSMHSPVFRAFVRQKTGPAIQTDLQPVLPGIITPTDKDKIP